LFVGESEGNPEHRVCMAQQCNRSAEHRRLGMNLSAAEEPVVVETLSLRYVHGVRGGEIRASLRINLC